MIDQTVIFSIERLQKRSIYCQKLLVEQGFPREKIKIFNGVDVQGLKTRQELIEFAIEEKGYKFLKNLEVYDLNHEVSNLQELAYLAQMISHLCLFNQIAQSDQNIFIIFDDRRLGILDDVDEKNIYSEIQTILQNEIPEDFYFVGALQDYAFNPAGEDEIERSLWSPAEGKRTLIGLQYQIDNAMVVSPKGASYLFEAIKHEYETHPNHALEGIMGTLLREANSAEYRNYFHTFDKNWIRSFGSSHGDVGSAISEWRGK